MEYILRYRYGHVEVYNKTGRFLFSADNETEAHSILKEWLLEEF